MYTRQENAQISKLIQESLDIYLSMNYIKHKDTIASKAFNNEKFILVTDDEEVLRLTPSKTVAHERSTTIIEEEESSITFHGLQPSKGQQRQEKSVFLCEPKLKSLKLSPASFRSGNDTGR